MYVFFTTDHDPVNGIVMGRSVLAWSDDGAQTSFQYLGDLSKLDLGGKFINVSVVKLDYPNDLGLPASLLLWGSGLYRRSNPYLAYLPLASLEAQTEAVEAQIEAQIKADEDQIKADEDQDDTKTINEGGGVPVIKPKPHRPRQSHQPFVPQKRLTGLHYFAGIEAGSLQPRWSEQESDAIALFEHPVIGELSVTWNPFLRRWLMLYNNGDVEHYSSENPRGINFRVAEKPWGPWSPTALLFDPWDRYDEIRHVHEHGGYCHFMHRAWEVDPATKKVNPATQCDSVYDNILYDESSDSFPWREFKWGSEYGPYVISPYTRGDSTHTTIYFVMSTWNPYTTVLMKSTLQLEPAEPIIAGASHTDYSGNPVLVQSRFGTAGNFEVVVPLTGGGLAHFWRNNDLPHFPWSNPTLFATGADQFDAIAFIQSDLGNFEVVARAVDRLVSFRRDATSPFTWHGPDPVVAVNLFGVSKGSVRVEAVTGVAGTPALTQSRFGSVENFELVVPLAGGGLAHYQRSNDSPRWHGPTVHLEPQTHFEAVSLIQSDLGNFEVVARAVDRLVSFRRDATSPFTWHGPFPLIADGQPITNIAGNPALIQSRTGNFELVVPLTSAGFAHYWRDNESPGHLWHGPTIVETLNQFKAVSLIQSNLGGLGNLEVVSLKNHLRPTFLGHFSPTSDQLAHTWRDSQFHWSGPFDFTSS